MQALSPRHDPISRTDDETTVQEVVGKPIAWPFLISDDPSGMFDVLGATILDIFVTQQRLFVYMQTVTGSQTIAVFLIEDQELRERTAAALKPGTQLADALQTPV